MEMLIAAIAGMYLTTLALILVPTDEEVQIFLDSTALMLSAIIGFILTLWMDGDYRMLVGYAVGIVAGWMFEQSVLDWECEEILE